MMQTNNTTDKTYKIGEIASAAGVTVEALRYYEQMNLIASVGRASTSNYRVYSGDTIYEVRFIKKAQSLGFTLKEISELLSLKLQQDSSCQLVREVAQARLAEVEKKMDDLARMKTALLTLLDRCNADAGSVGECSIIQALTPNLLEDPTP